MAYSGYPQSSYNGGSRDPSQQNFAHSSRTQSPARGRSSSNPFNEDSQGETTSTHSQDQPRFQQQEHHQAQPQEQQLHYRQAAASTSSVYQTPLNPFLSPAVSRATSRPGSTFGSSSAVHRELEVQGQRYFQSRRLRKGEVEKPWLEKRDPKEKWVTILPLLGILIGVILSAVLIWQGLSSVVHHKYCLVYEDEFKSGGLDSRYWQKEVQLGGFGNGEFEQTTGGDTNVYVKDGTLFIKPTLQNPDLLHNNNVIDLRKSGTCTTNTFLDCVAATNVSAGNSSIVPPVLSGRINTKKGAHIQYGRVEVVAKLPKGDWLWPAIWMMPVNNTYGPWPASGEIDIMESRGNNRSYSQGGNNIISSALHWGPDKDNDGWWRTNNKLSALHTTYSDDFNTFGLEWSQNYLFTYINSRLMQVLYTPFEQSLWDRGQFPSANANGSLMVDPWVSGRPSTPFDQPFYLILNVAVGGTNGWFEDGQSNKPWVNGSPKAKKDFWTAQKQWYPTWTDPAMQIKRVSMWQQCDGNEGLAKTVG